MGGCLDEWVRLPLLGELPVVVVMVEVVLVLGLYFDGHGYLDRLHNCLGVHVRVMLHWDMDADPAIVKGHQLEPCHLLIEGFIALLGTVRNRTGSSH